MTSPILQEEEEKPMAPVKLRVKMGRGRKASLKEINDSEAASLAAVSPNAKLATPQIVFLDLTWRCSKPWEDWTSALRCSDPVHLLGTQGSDW